MGHPSAFDSNLDQPRQLQLVVHAGPLAGKGFPIRGNMLTIGRDADNDISLDDEQVSRYHARLLLQEDQIILEDLGSTNGTLVAGKPVVGQHVLQPADIISIGSSVFGVKGFSAPSTVGMTQLSSDAPPFPAPIAAPAPPRPSAPISSTPTQARSSSAEPSRLTLVAIGGGLALVVTIIIIAAFTAYYFVAGGNRESAAGVPNVIITAPANGSQVQVGRPVTVQATASDPAGIQRMELWVSGQKVSEAVSPAQGQSTLTASFQWTAAAPGTYTLEIRAYNQQGAVNSPAMVSVNAVAAMAGTETPTPTVTPGTPTATVSTEPHLVTKTDLNVRAGPGTEYDLLGLLPNGATTEIVGQDGSRQWWQIRFAPAADGLGWVSADPAYAQAFNIETVPVVASPPTPTGTPTPTATSTGTPTVTSTATPTLTPTATEPAETLEFDVTPTSIQGGECVYISWNVTGVREVYINGVGVGGIGNTEDCPRETTTYRMRVVRLDGSEYTEEITVQVFNPIESAGIITVNPNQTVDFDDGVIPGNDFLWNVQGITRTFQIQPGAQLAPMRVVDDLADITLSECANANYGQYTYIDASDNIADPNNALVAGRAACYRTNEGRLGKMRFPAYSTGALNVEWLTWR